MGEKLELKLKSPVGAEAAGYPWPLPIYVSIQFVDFQMSLNHKERTDNSTGNGTGASWLTS